jgi:hypothetical protein
MMLQKRTKNGLRGYKRTVLENDMLMMHDRLEGRRRTRLKMMGMGPRIPVCLPGFFEGDEGP